MMKRLYLVIAFILLLSGLLFADSGGSVKNTLSVKKGEKSFVFGGIECASCSNKKVTFWLKSLTGQTELQVEADAGSKEAKLPRIAHFFAWLPAGEYRIDKVSCGSDSAIIAEETVSFSVVPEEVIYYGTFKVRRKLKAKKNTTPPVVPGKPALVESSGLIVLQEGFKDKTEALKEFRERYPKIKGAIHVKWAFPIK